MNKHLEIHKLARSRGRELATLDEGEYMRLALEVRTTREIARDAARAAGAVVRKSIGLFVVPEDIALERAEKCRANRCGSYQRIGKRGVEVCHRCNCSGRRLEAKWASPGEKCPANPPIWGVYTGVTIERKAVE